MTVVTYADALRHAQSANAVVLTGNNRLRRRLLGDWEQQQQAEQSVWQTPNVQAFRAWMRSLWELSMAGVLANWQHPQAGALLLSNEQAERLWLQAVKADSATVLVNQAAAARAGHRAWQLLEQWQLRQRQWPHYCSADMTAFQGWRQRVENRLQQEHWVDSAELPALLASLIAETQIKIPETVYVLGLQHLTPTEEQVLAALESRGCQISSLALPTQAARQSLFAAASPSEELQQAATWARHKLDQNSSAQLAIVLLNAAQQQAPMRDALMRALHPDRVWGQAETGDRLAFNFSLGAALSKQPVVQLGLQLLQWLNHALPVEQVAVIVQSPWLQGSHAEHEARAQLARLILENDQPQCSIERARYLATKRNLPCMGLLQQLDAAREAWQTLKESFPERAADWLAPLAQCLNEAGWVQRQEGDIALDSETWQAAQHFSSTLNKVAELDLVTAKFNGRDIVAAVQQAAENTIYQAQGSDAPVQVLGPLEAIGQNFDALWVVGANDETLPTPVRPDPYIPREWQRELAMPRASVAREQEWAQQLVQQLSVTANEVCFSYFAADGDNPYRPAQAVSKLPVAEPLADMQGQWLQGLAQSLDLESVDDSMAPAIPGTHPVNAPGGSKLFEDQAACAFRAFAHWRLRAKAIQLPEWGMDAQELGICLHKALQLFWDEHQHHSVLSELEDAELGLRVRAAIAKAAESRPSTMDAKLNTALQALQQAILQPLIVEWLQLEKTRAPFRNVKTEQSLQVAIGRLRLDMQVDRIDQLEDDSVVVVDYKTSRRLSVAAWNPPRPEQPQLPLYAVQLSSNKQAVAAVMFAQLAPGSVQPVGLTNDESIMAGLQLGDFDEAAAKPGKYQPPLQQLLPEWTEELTELAEQFAEGHAEVMPKDASSCAYCDLKPLCRIDFAEQPA
jgi:probable DNA repair protein